MPLSFDELYMELAKKMAMKSHCVKISVGAVLAKDTRIISVGYNGPPAKTYNCDEKWPETGCQRSVRGGCSLALHAEENAIIYASKNKINLEGSTLYLTLSPCLSCARLVYSFGIKEVIYLDSYAEYKKLSSDEGLNFLRQFGVIVKRRK